jgi:DNA-binding MarR family transcriptional regulator
VIIVSPKYQAGFLISKIQKISQKVFHRKLAENNLKIHPGQGRVLFALWNKDSVPIKDLVKKTGLPKTTLSSILKRLREDGQIEEPEPSEKDRRELIIKLSDKNKKLHPLYEKVSKQMEDIYYRGFSEEDKKNLDSLLNRILDNLEGK